jgi:GTPase SAR1 family protein
MEVGDRNIKLTIWDTAGEEQERWQEHKQPAACVAAVLLCFSQLLV